MKKLLIYVLSIMAILSITACGGNQNSSNTSNSSSKDSEPVTIDIYQFKVEIAEAFEELANEYMKENPNVTINIETVGGGADYGASLRAKMASGNEPTIFNVGGPQDVYDWKDKLVDLSDVPVVKEAFDGATAGVTMDGKVYGIPFTQEGYGFIYNKALFTKAGIDPKTITSFAKLEEAVKTLDSKKSELGIESVFALAGKETWVTGLHFTNVALSPEFENVFNAFNSKTVAFKYSEGMQKLFDLQVKYGKTPVNSVDYSTQVEKLFSLQKVAIIQQGNWTMGAIKGIDEELANNIGFLPMPIIGAKEDSIPVGIPMYWTVNKTKDEKTQKAAKDFLNWIYTSEKGKDYVINKFGFIPPFKGYEAENLQPKDALAKDIMDYSKNGKTIQWVFMGYPSGWGMEKMGVDLQKYVDGKLTWNQVMENGKKSWEEARKK
ncbi:MAG: extracellular solute-binding protein [Fusobacteriaceae bacterium]|nr:extracellular solute-binding protein [Fusobacteriaceae bacterium]MBN2838411.1 extracellular solute-binding protein [Fusobacteriaceae bacterium]